MAAEALAGTSALYFFGRAFHAAFSVSVTKRCVASGVIILAACVDGCVYTTDSDPLIFMFPFVPDFSTLVASVRACALWL